jgi:hypothetical protein
MTMCDISEGGGGCLQRNVHMTFLMQDKIDMWGSQGRTQRGGARGATAPPPEKTIYDF